MAKKDKAPGSIPNRQTYTRINFLYQAAAHLAALSQQEHSDPERQTRSHHKLLASTPSEDKKDSLNIPGQRLQALSRRLVGDMRAISQKTLLRVGPEIKRTICKRCDTFLIEGQTCTSTVENKSRGARKPWADVLVIKCNACGTEKRFPVAAPRQKRKILREVTKKDHSLEEAAPSTRPP